MTKPLEIAQAVTLLRAGRLVAFPTETVYGLGADATNEAAIRDIFRAKERPYDHPLIVHVANEQQIEAWARDISPAARKLAQAFWPGPLTMIFKKQPQVLDIVTGGQDTIGIRIPHHPVAQALLQAFGGGIAAPSANKFTHISPTTATAVFEELGNSVDLILDGGECQVGLESTILDMSSAQPVILRPGMITAQKISEVLGFPILLQRQDTPIRAPGMHHLHYAPRTKTQLVSTSEIASVLEKLSAQMLPIVFVVYSKAAMRSLATLDPKTKSSVHCITLSDNPADYAHDLYRTLRSLDNQQYRQIMIETVPDAPAWEAIRDRLSKASGRK